MGSGGHVVRFALWISTLLLVVLNAFGAPAEPLTIDEFKGLVAELAPKVNFFHEVWDADPKAEFYGGTSRDFLYWVKGQFRKAKTRAEIEAVKAQLRARTAIDVRDFILFESDVDLVSEARVSVDAVKYGVKKVDLISADRFDLRTDAGRNERDQGYIPAEKIRLSKKGIVASQTFGDGVREIFESKLTIHFADEATFWKTHFASRGLNHPVLLALRFLRLVGVDYFYSEGRGLPNTGRLFARMSAGDRKKVGEVISAALSDPRLPRMLGSPKFAEWTRTAAHKAFRSYTNPNAAKILFEHFGADRLSHITDGSGRVNAIDPVNHTLFAATRDPEAIEKNYKRYGVDDAKLLQSVSEHFPDGRIYHGTKTEPDFRSILFQGIRPSEDGSAGRGLYGVSNNNIQFAINWGGSIDRVVMIELSSNTRIADVNSGYGQELYRKFARDHQGVEDLASAFAEAFGLDIVKYVYQTDAYVVKNGGVLRGANGYTRKLLSLDKFLAYVRDPKTDIKLEEILKMARINGFSAPEVAQVVAEPRVAAGLKAYEGFSVQELAAIEDTDVREIVFRLPVFQKKLRAELKTAFSFGAKLPSGDSWRDFARVLADAGVEDSIIGNTMQEIITAKVTGLSTTELRETLVKAIVKKNFYVLLPAYSELARRAGHAKAAESAASDAKNVFKNIHYTGTDATTQITQALFVSEENLPTGQAPEIMTVDMMKEILKTRHYSAVKHLCRYPTFANDPAADALLVDVIQKFGFEYVFDHAFDHRAPKTWNWVAKRIAVELMNKVSLKPGYDTIDAIANFIKLAASKAPANQRDALVSKAYRLARKHHASSGWNSMVGMLLVSARLNDFDIAHDVIADARDHMKIESNSAYNFRGLDEGEAKIGVRDTNLRSVIDAAESGLRERRAAPTCHSLFAR